MADNLVKRLQDNVADIVDWNGKVMTAWDTVRAMISNGNKGSLPRDIMESYLFGYAEDMAEAADHIEQLEIEEKRSYRNLTHAMKNIEKLEAALQRANANVEEYERKFYLGTDRIEKLEAALRTIYDCCDETGNCSVVRRIVRKALEGKDD